MKRLTQREKNLVVIAGFVVAVGLGGALLRPVWQKTQQMKNHLRILEARRDRRAREVRELQQRLPAGPLWTEEEVVLIEPDKVFAEMVQTLEEHVRDKALKMLVIKPLDVESHDQPITLPVEISLEGNLVDIMKFFFEIQQKDAAFNVEEWRLHAQERQSLRCQATVSRSYWVVEEINNGGGKGVVLK